MVAQLVSHHGMTRWRTDDGLFYVQRYWSKKHGTVWHIVWNARSDHLPYTALYRSKLWIRWCFSRIRARTIGDVRKKLTQYYGRPIPLRRENDWVIHGWPARIIRDDRGWYVTSHPHITYYPDAQNDFDLLSNERFKTRFAALDAFNGWETMWGDVA